MNALMLIGMTSTGQGGGIGAGADQCALLLFLSGFISLVIAAYLLYKAPKFQPIRYVRRYPRP